VIEPILVLNRVRARSSWLGLGAEPSADRSPNRCRIVWRGPYENNCRLLNACLHLLIIPYWDV